MGKRGRKRLLWLLALAVLLGTPPARASAAEDAASGKIINVVYDDSRSMYLNGETRWCQAKYAMEVFCAMLGAQDEMNIYSMNRPDILSVRGSDETRVEQVHAMTSTYAGTPFDTVRRAGDALVSAGDGAERWLIVLTDGTFEQTTVSTVQSTLDGYNDAGIHTVYLAIGDTAVELQGNVSRGAFAEKAATTGDILAKVTSIANQIFEHQVLGSKFVSASAEGTLLDIDIPIGQLVVFAQGEDARVGDVTLNGAALQPTSVHYVRHSGDVMPLNDEDIRVDTSLYGVVATYEAGDAPFERGQYAVAVEGAASVEYYYRPGVEVNCGLLYNGQPVYTDDKLYAGEYEAVLRFIDPFTGEAVDSELLSAAQFTLSVANNGSMQTLTAKTGTITLAEGEVEVRAAAELPGNITMTSARFYTVLPEPVELRLTVEPNDAVYRPDQMGERAAPLTVRAVDAATGEAMDPEAWEGAELLAESAGGVAWSVTKSGEAGVWELRPRSADGTVGGVETGELTFPLSVSYQAGQRCGYGAGTFSITVEPYAGSELVLDISAPAGGYDLGDMDHPAPMEVHVRMLDAQTGETVPVSEALWESMEAEAASEDRVAWELEKGDEPGLFLLRPGFYLGDVLLTESGPTEVTVTAEGAEGDLTYSGSASAQTELRPLSLMELLRELAPRIVISLFLLWLLIGYLKKKRLRTRGLNPRCSFKGTQSPKQRISKDFFSVVLPYVPERATVYCSKAAFQCQFPNLRIQASGRYSFKIINKTMPLKTVKIAGEIFPDMEALHQRNFAFSSFDIATYDPKTKRTSGKFTFR